VNYLFGNDLGNSLQESRFAFDHALSDGVSRFRLGNDEIDLADVRENQFQETVAVAGVVTWRNFQVEVVFFRIEECKQLRVVQEKIDCRGFRGGRSAASLQLLHRRSNGLWRLLPS
jgi:hypothetical protein